MSWLVEGRNVDFLIAILQFEYGVGEGDPDHHDLADLPPAEPDATSDGDGDPDCDSQGSQTDHDARVRDREQGGESEACGRQRRGDDRPRAVLGQPGATRIGGASHCILPLCVYPHKHNLNNISVASVTERNFSNR